MEFGLYGVDLCEWQSSGESRLMVIPCFGD